MAPYRSPLLQPLHALQLPGDEARILKGQGIVTAGQAYDMATTRPAALRALKIDADDLKDRLQRQWPQLARTAEAMRSAKPWPAALSGLPGAPEDFPPWMAARRHQAPSREALRESVTRRLKKARLPSRVSHADYLPQPYDQGPHPFCVGFGATCSRDYLARNWMSNGFAYRGAKSLDGRPDVDGSFQAFAMEFFYQQGHVPIGAYSYQDAIKDRPIQPLFKQAGRWKINGYVDLLPDDKADYELVPDLIRAILAGRLVDDLGPRNLSVSLALYESFNSYTTQTTGLVPLPGSDERRTGGHAMNLVGYLNARDPNGLFDTDWFIVRNSWGGQWAAENPLGLPGHALIPAAYFANPDWLWELLICIAEPPPRPVLAWLRSVGRGFRRLSS